MASTLIRLAEEWRGLQLTTNAIKPSWDIWKSLHPKSRPYENELLELSPDQVEIIYQGFVHLKIADSRFLADVMRMRRT